MQLRQASTMASTMIGLRGAAASALLGRIGTRARPACAVPALNLSHFFSTEADGTSSSSSSSDDERSVDVQPRSDRLASSRRQGRAPTLFSDAFDPFSPTRSLSQVLNLMDQLMDDPFSRGVGAGSRRGWDVREEDGALYLRIDMPGLGKEDVNISVDQNTLTIRAEGDRESDDEESWRRYSSRIDLPQNLYSVNEIKAEMKNGVLRVFVPKVKEEERKDVFQVQVQ